MSTHRLRVDSLMAQVKRFHANQEPYRIYHGSTNSTRPDHKTKTIDISGLSNILNIDIEKQLAIVEPNVPMDRLVEATTQNGLVPPVVMEFPGITVGGGFAGSAGESSSFKYGYFNETIRSVEMLLADGRLVTASRDKNSELFHGAAGALGTMGIVTLLEIELIQAKKYVKTTYRRTSSTKEAVDAIQHATRQLDNDYVDGILFSENHGVIITGQITDEEPASKTYSTFSGPWDPWYYLHVQEMTKKASSELVTEHIPLAEYLFRYDRGGFWVGCEAFRYFPFIPFNRFTRWFLDDFMHTRMLYRALHGSGASFGVMVQDLSLPHNTAGDFINYTSDDLGIWPLWLCPLRETVGPSFHPHTDEPGPGEACPMLNIGLWGRASKNVKRFVEQNRSVERKLVKLGGRKVLYSHTCYTEDEFWDIYDRDWYDDLRERYSATHLPSVFDKVKVDLSIKPTSKSSLSEHFLSHWPCPGIRGIRKAIKSKEYFLHRDAAWAFKRID